jgi:hypothetical protein
MQRIIQEEEYAQLSEKAERALTPHERAMINPFIEKLALKADKAEDIILKAAGVSLEGLTIHSLTAFTNKTAVPMISYSSTDPLVVKMIEQIKEKRQELQKKTEECELKFQVEMEETLKEKQEEHILKVKVLQKILEENNQRLEAMIDKYNKLDHKFSSLSNMTFLGRLKYCFMGRKFIRQYLGEDEQD